MRNPTSLAVLLFPLATACQVHSHKQYEPSSPEVTLKTTDDDEARQVRYKVRAGDGDAPTIDRVDTRKVGVAQLGLYTSSIDKDAANERGLTAWRGVYIDSLVADSAAQAAGLAPGDVLLALDAIELVSTEQFREVVESELAPGRVGTARLLRRRDDGSWSELTLEVTPKAKNVGETTIDSFPLEWNYEVKRRTGLDVGTVPESLAREMWNRDASVALVAGVVSGSAGYRGGLRTGDVIERCNGEVVRSAADIAGALTAGAKQLDLEVNGPLGSHRATITTSEDIGTKNEFDIPIVLRHASSVSHSETSFLDFIFQFGFNRRRTSWPSTTRAPDGYESLSILPLGMFEFTSTPDGNETTIFWIISWSTKR
jgi:hypothetical protein